MNDIERIIDLIVKYNGDGYWRHCCNIRNILFEENGVLYFISSASIDALAIWEFDVTKLIYMALAYYDIDKPFEILHPILYNDTHNTSIFIHNRKEYLYKKGYSYLTDTRNVYLDNYKRICEVQTAELITNLICEWKLNKAILLEKILNKYHDYINVKNLIDIVDDITDIPFDVKSVLLRFIHENNSEERNLEL